MRYSGKAELEVKLESMKHQHALAAAREQRSDAAAPITENYEVMHKCQYVNIKISSEDHSCGQKHYSNTSPSNSCKCDLS